MESLRTRKEQSTTGTMQQPPNKHTIFCDKVGIKQPPNTSDLEEAYQIKPVDGGFYKRVLNAYQCKTHQRRFIVTIIHILQLLQIIFGATATAISASKVPTMAVTVLTAIMTVVAGILAFIRDHLDRIRQRQDNLRKVRDYIRFKEMEYRGSAPRDAIVEEAMVKEVMAEMKKLYDNAVVGNKGDKTKSPGA